MNMISHFWFRKERIFFLLIIFLSISQLSGIKNVGSGRYLFQPGTPVAIKNFYQADEICYWFGVVGQVFLDGEPIDNLIVKLNGSLDGEEILIYAVTGGSPRLGPGGYEIVVADRNVDSTGSLFIQLINSSGIQISPSLPIDTYSGCDRNLVLVNFIWVTAKNDLFLPNINR